MAINYTLNWSDDSLKAPFVLVGGTINNSLTSLTLTGKSSVNWGEPLQENLIRLLENFASNGTAPAQPTTGQLWFNNSDSYLKFYYNAAWHDIAKRAINFASAPSGANRIGDLWYDTTNDLLKVYTNSGTWVSVCSQCGGSPSPTPTSAPTAAPTPTSSPTPAPTPASTPAPTSLPSFTATATTTSGSHGQLTLGSVYTSYNLVLTNLSAYFATNLSSATLLSGSLPVGMSLIATAYPTSNAAITGQPLTTGSFSGTIRVSHGTIMSPSFRDVTFFIDVTTSTPAPTAAPTTSAPTAAPTPVFTPTAAPTTAAPTTAAPVATVGPTTGPPTTGSPTTSAPTTAAPTTSAPTTAAPTTAAPTTAAPTPSPTPTPTVE